jgi:hypothetical protein
MAQMNQNDDTLTPIQWTVARPDAPVLSVPSAVCNLCLEVDKELYVNPVGERWAGGRPATWLTTPPGIDGSHRCGTDDDFRLGGTFDDTLPPPKIGAFGWPLCCSPPRKVFGGGGGSGKPVIHIVRPVRIRGGAAISGQVKLGPKFIDPGEGGFDFGGESGDLFYTTDPAAGGFDFGGASADLFYATDPAAGGFDFGGASGDEVGTTDPAAGGFDFGGASGDVACGPLLMDLFNANPGTLDGRPVESGLDTPQNWQSPVGPWQAGSRQATLTTGAMPDVVAWANASTADVLVQITVRAFAPHTANIGGLVFRLASATNFFAFVVELDGGVTANFHLSRINGASRTTLASGFTGLGGVTLSVSLSGSSILAMINGITVASVTSTDNLTSTGFGLYGYRAGTYLTPPLSTFQVRAC